MELQEFISSVLVSLVRGVEEAQKQLKDSKAIVNPLGIKAEIALRENTQTPGFTNVEFEVTVEVQSKSEQNEGIEVRIAVLKAGGNGKKLYSESNASKLRFSVPIHLPPGDILIESNES